MNLQRIVGSNGVLAIVICFCSGCEYTDTPVPPSVQVLAPRVAKPIVLVPLTTDFPASPSAVNPEPPAAVAKLPQLSIAPIEAPATSRVPVAPAAATIVRGRLAFVEGYAAGVQRASRENKPMLIFFTATWCKYCHQMAAEAFTDPRVVGLSQRFVCVLIDADADRALCGQFGVRGFPTVQFASPDGAPLNRLVGKRTTAEVLGQMQLALQIQAGYR